VSCLGARLGQARARGEGGAGPQEGERGREKEGKKKGRKEKGKREEKNRETGK
jgi:hypothetical protein